MQPCVSTQLLSSRMLRVDGRLYIRTYRAAELGSAHGKWDMSLDFAVDRGQREQLLRVECLPLTCGTAPIHQRVENKSPAITSSQSACSYLSVVWRVQLCITQTFYFLCLPPPVLYTGLPVHLQRLSRYCQSRTPPGFPFR